MLFAAADDRGAPLPFHSPIAREPAIERWSQQFALLSAPDRPKNLRELYQKCDLWGVARIMLTLLVPSLSGSQRVWEVSAFVLPLCT